MERELPLVDIERQFRAALELVLAVEPTLDKAERFQGALRDWQAGKA